MDRPAFGFDLEKAVETILYLATKIKKPTFHSVTHLLYFSDKTSLERYGRFICGDEYYAMKYGPVPTNTYNLLKMSSDTEHFGFKSEGYNVIPLRNPNTDLLSDSDIECLDQTIELYGSVPFWKLKEDSHDDAWKQAWDSRGSKQSKLMSIESIVELLEEPEVLMQFLNNRNSD